MKAKWMTGADPGTGGELVDHRRVDRWVGGEVEVVDALVAGEAGVVGAAGRAALVPVVAFGHEQFGEEAEVGQLFAFGGCGDLGEPVPDRRQPQHARAGLDRGDGGLFGDAAPRPALAIAGGCAAGGHEVAFPRRSS
jgi:hypothetical protein